ARIGARWFSRQQSSTFTVRSPLPNFPHSPRLTTNPVLSASTRFEFVPVTSLTARLSAGLATTAGRERGSDEQAAGVGEQIPTTDSMQMLGRGCGLALEWEQTADAFPR